MEKNVSAGNLRGSVEVKTKPALNFEIIQEAMVTGEPYPNLGGQRDHKQGAGDP